MHKQSTETVNAMTSLSALMGTIININRTVREKEPSLFFKILQERTIYVISAGSFC